MRNISYISGNYYSRYEGTKRTEPQIFSFKTIDFSKLPVQQSLGYNNWQTKLYNLTIIYNKAEPTFFNFKRFLPDIAYSEQSLSSMFKNKIYQLQTSRFQISQYIRKMKSHKSKDETYVASEMLEPILHRLCPAAFLDYFLNKFNKSVGSLSLNDFPGEYIQNDPELKQLVLGSIHFVEYEHLINTRILITSFMKELNFPPPSNIKYVVTSSRLTDTYQYLSSEYGITTNTNKQFKTTKHNDIYIPLVSCLLVIESLYPFDFYDLLRKFFIHTDESEAMPYYLYFDKPEVEVVEQNGKYTELSINNFNIIVDTDTNYILWNTIKKNITQYHSLEEFLTYDDMSILAESKDLYLPKFSKRRNISFKLNELHKYPVFYTINDKTKYAGDYIHIEILIQLLGFVNPFATSDLMRILRTLLTDTEDLENLQKYKDGYFRLQECFKKVFNSESSSTEQNDIDDGASYIQSVDTGFVDDLIII